MPHLGPGKRDYSAPARELICHASSALNRTLGHIGSCTLFGVVEDSPDRLVLTDELRRAERHAIVSRLSSVFAHLIGTPLNVIAGRAALIKSNPESAAALENATRIEQQVERLAVRIRRL